MPIPKKTKTVTKGRRNGPVSQVNEPQVILEVRPDLQIMEKTPKHKDGSGHLTQYRGEPHDAVAHNAILLGESHRKIAALIGIEYETFRWWLRTHPSFKKAVKDAEGKDGKIALSMYMCAEGYFQDVERVHFNKNDTMVRYTEKVWVPPNVSAQKYLLGSKHRDTFGENVTVKSQNTNLNVNATLSSEDAKSVYEMLRNMSSAPTDFNDDNIEDE